jgi:uncharacterized alkaline shock family protein YloU
MNVFNRIVMILVILVAFVVVTIGLAVPVQTLTVAKAVVDNTLHTLERIRPVFILPLRALLVLCAVAVDVLLIGLLMFEVRGPARHTIRVQQVGGGIVAVTTEALAERLQYHLDQLADVISVKVKVMPRGPSVDLDMEVRTGADVNVPEKAEQVLEVARQVVEDKMGLKLARKPRVNIHAMPTPGAPARAVTPAHLFQPTSSEPPKTPSP